MKKSELLVDVRDHDVDSLMDFRTALVAVNHEALHHWQGRSLDALWDVIENRGFSDLLDSHDVLVVRARRSDFLSEEHPVGQVVLRIFADATHARLELS